MKKALATFALLLAVSFLPGVSHADDSEVYCTLEFPCIQKAGRIVLNPESPLSGECLSRAAATCRGFDRHLKLARKRAAVRRRSHH